MDKKLKTELPGRNLEFTYLGTLQLERDKAGQVIQYPAVEGAAPSSVLGIATPFTKDGKPIVIRRLPNNMRDVLGGPYVESKTLAGIWNEPGIYLFVDEKDWKNGMMYVGRASNSVFKRISAYLAPQTRVRPPTFASTGSSPRSLRAENRSRSISTPRKTPKRNCKESLILRGTKSDDCWPSLLSAF